jgi:uncharacterized protein
MKYLVLFAVLLVAYLVWRNNRRKAQSGQAPHRAASGTALPQDMVRCSVCSLHLPRAEALAGSHGDLYCSQEHRLGASN